MKKTKTSDYFQIGKLYEIKNFREAAPGYIVITRKTPYTIWFIKLGDESMKETGDSEVYLRRFYRRSKNEFKV